MRTRGYGSAPVGNTLMRCNSNIYDETRGKTEYSCDILSEIHIYADFSNRNTSVRTRNELLI